MLWSWIKMYIQKIGKLIEKGHLFDNFRLIVLQKTILSVGWHLKISQNRKNVAVFQIEMRFPIHF